MQNLVVRLEDLTVRLATRLQSLDAHAAIASRHEDFVHSVRVIDAVDDSVVLPGVCSVLSRWWKLRVPNTYKEAAWRRALNAFPTAVRMGLQTATCAACGFQGPCVRHHFWSCPVARAVRFEMEAQLVAFGMFPPGVGHLKAANLWLCVRPHADLLPWVWDLVCIAAVHAMETGRAAAWAVSRDLSVPVLVEDVAKRAATAAFWSALADFAATASVPRAARGPALTRQPFLAWHVVVVRGSGLRVVRR